MALQTNKSVMAIVPEVTDGTPVSPTAANQYVALQEGFDAEPAFETLENSELSGTIGAAKAILGLENPSASFSHYLKHSGTEGAEPEHGKLLEAAFGAKSVNATEYNTVASSTVSVVKVDTGEGAFFERGEALLIKDPVNGYKIRPILSVSGDDLTLGIQLPTASAPGVGVNLGKAVLYKPGEAHPTFTSWLYMANGGAVQMLAGGRVTEMTISAEAGQFINSDFSIGAVGYYFNPVEITASTDTLDFNDGTNRVATVASGFFKDPKDLAAALQTAMNAAGSSDTFTVLYSDTTGKFTLSTSGATLILKFATGANTAQTIATKIGFTVADEAGPTSTSDVAMALASPQTPSYNTTSPLVAKANEIFLGDESVVNPACFSAQSVTVTLGDEKQDVLDICAESGKSGSLIIKRTVSVDVVAQIPQYDADKFHRFHSGTNTSFLFNFGEKSGGNWIPGKAGCFYIPTATISSYKLSDDNGLVTLEMTLTGYVSSGLGEAYLNLL